MSLKRLLATTDFSQRSERALKRAASLCRAFSAELQILHVVDDDQPAGVVEQETRQAEAILKSMAEALREESGREPVTMVRCGDPFQAIAQTAVEVGADVVAMGAHRKNILRDMFAGTTIERVMRTGHHPVLMVNLETRGHYRRIIVATDMSSASANALRLANELGLFDGAHLSLLHVFQAFAKGKLMYSNVKRETIETYVANEASEVSRRLAEFVASLGITDLRYDIQLEEGETTHSIKKAVDKHMPDLLVIGTRGLTGAKRLLLGSVADAVLRGVSCDVLAVPPSAE